MLRNILLADRLDRACNALERIAGALERAYPAATGQEETRRILRKLGEDPLPVASNEDTWLNELEDYFKRESVVQQEEGEEAPKPFQSLLPPEESLPDTKS